MSTRSRLALAALGVFLVLGALLAKGSRKSMDKTGLGASATQIDKLQWPHVYDISAEEKARENPVQFTELSVARGRKVFLSQCAVCHGVKADGKGDMAIAMKISPSDFTNPETLKNRTDGEVFAIMSHGFEAMPSQGARLTELHKWYLVNYLRAVSGKTPEKSDPMEPGENIVVAPNTVRK